MAPRRETGDRAALVASMDAVVVAQIETDPCALGEESNGATADVECRSVPVVWEHVFGARHAEETESARHHRSKVVLAPLPRRREYQVSHHRHRMTLADDNRPVTGEEPGRPDDRSFDAENPGAQQRNGSPEILMHLGRAVARVRQIRICRERPADRRDELPLGGGNGWKCKREQYPGCKTRQKTREH